MMDIANLLKRERNEYVKKIKMMFEDIHYWIARQTMVVQIGILFGAAFLVIAVLMKAFA